MTASDLSQKLADVKTRQEYVGYAYTTEEDFNELQQVYVKQVATVTLPQARANNWRKLFELRAFYESAIQPLFDEARRIDHLATERGKEARQEKVPDVDFSDAVNDWKPEYNLDLNPTQSEYELILTEANEEALGRLLMRVPYVVSEILGTTPSACTITKDGDVRKCSTDKLYPWMAHGWTVVPAEEIVHG